MMAMMKAKRPAASEIVPDVRVMDNDPSNPGWVRHEYARKSGRAMGTTYSTFKDPHGQKYTSMKQAQLNGYITVVS